MAGIQRACQKRPVSQEDIERLVESIIEDISNNFDREVSHRDLGERVMAGLRTLDPVAYVRFASVYRRFEEATDFVQEVQRLEKKHDTLTARLPGF
jgi:transcriptional repressor NrdR